MFSVRIRLQLWPFSFTDTISLGIATAIQRKTLVFLI